MAFYLKLITYFQLKNDEGLRLEMRHKIERGLVKFYGSPKITIALIIFVLITCPLMGYKAYKAEHYVLGEDYIDLNEEIKNGNIPKEGEYVKVTYNMVGDIEYAAGHDEYVVFPVALIDKGEEGKGDIFEVIVSSSNNLDKFNYHMGVSNDYFKEGATDNGEPVFVSYGRFAPIVSTADDYKKVVENSGISANDYNIRQYFINTRVQKQVFSARMYWLFLIMFFGFGTGFMAINILDYYTLKLLYPNGDYPKTK